MMLLKNDLLILHWNISPYQADLSSIVSSICIQALDAFPYDIHDTGGCQQYQCLRPSGPPDQTVEIRRLILTTIEGQSESLR